MTVLTSVGAPIVDGGALVTSGFEFLDGFTRADGPVGNGWSDAADLYPTMFDASVIVSGAVSTQASHPNEYSTPDPNTLVGHSMIARDIGVSDDFEVTLCWILNGGLSGVQQISPVAFVDLNSADSGQMGVLPVWDISIVPAGATYVQNAFRNPIGEFLDPAEYDLLGGSVGGPPPTNNGYVIQTIGMRVESGMISYSWDNNSLGTPFAVPAWAAGRTWMGVHIGALDWATTYPGGAPVTEPHPAVADNFRVRLL